MLAHKCQFQRFTPTEVREYHRNGLSYVSYVTPCYDLSGARTYTTQVVFAGAAIEQDRDQSLYTMVGLVPFGEELGGYLRDFEKIFVACYGMYCRQS